MASRDLRDSSSIFHANTSPINWGRLGKETEGIRTLLHFCLLKRLNNISAKLPTKSSWFNWLYKNVRWLTTISLQGEHWGGRVSFYLHSRNTLFITLYSNKTCSFNRHISKEILKLNVGDNRHHSTIKTLNFKHVCYVYYIQMRKSNVHVEYKSDFDPSNTNLEVGEQTRFSDIS